MTDHLDTRVAELAAQVKGLGEADRKHEKNLEALAETVATGFRELTKKVDARNITPWAAIIGFATFVLMVVGFVGGLARQPLVDAEMNNHAELRHANDLRREEDIRLRERVDTIKDEVEYLRGRIATMSEK